MTIRYAFFCDDCGKSSRTAIEVCEWCASRDITKTPLYAEVDYDDVADAKRMDEIRADRDVSMARGAKLLAELEAKRARK